MASSRPPNWAEGLTVTAKVAEQKRQVFQAEHDQERAEQIADCKEQITAMEEYDAKDYGGSAMGS